MAEDRKTKQVVKEGYLSKKGHVRHNWKTRWFTLFDDRLHYSSLKQDKTIKGKVNLQAATLISPCLEYTKRDFVFRLMQSDGKEFLFQCCTETDLSEWTIAISEVVRNLEHADAIHKTPTAAMKSVAQTTLGSSISHREIVDAMQDAEAGLSMTSHIVNGKSHKMCFCGSDLVAWLLCWSFVKTREEGCQVGAELVGQAFIRPIDGATAKWNDQDTAVCFMDSADYSYRFATILKSNSVDFDISESSSDSEDDNDDDDGYSALWQQINDLGGIIKQGFLLKKGHFRHNWKVRKFVLRDRHPFLLYYKPTKENQSKGRIPLKKAMVVELDEDEIIDASCTKTQKIDAETCFKIRTTKGRLFVLQAPSHQDKMEWIRCLETSIT